MNENDVWWPLATSTWDEEELDVLRSLDSRERLTMGPETKRFETSLANHFGSRFAVFCNSGSSANLLGMSALGLSAKDIEKNEVIVPTIGWSTTFYPVVQAGFTLKFIDVNLNTLNMSIRDIKSAINERTAGVMGVNLLGNPMNLEELRHVCDENNLFFFEDNCESMGASQSGKQAGTFGDISSFSTYFSHHISTIEGGFCLTDDEELYQKMLALRAHGWTRDLPHENHLEEKTGLPFDNMFRFLVPGYNLRPTEISSLLGLTQLHKLPKILEGRRKNGNHWMKQSRQVQWMITQKVSPDCMSSWFGFSIIPKPNTVSRDVLISTLEDLGVEYRPIVTGNFVKQPVMSTLRYSNDDLNFPNADYVHQQGLFIGNHHYDIRDKISTLCERLSTLE